MARKLSCILPVATRYRRRKFVLYFACYCFVHVHELNMNMCLRYIYVVFKVPREHFKLCKVSVNLTSSDDQDLDIKVTN